MEEEEDNEELQSISRVNTDNCSTAHSGLCSNFPAAGDLRYPESCCCHSESPSQTVKCCDFSLFVFLKTFANPIKLTVFEC